MGGASGIAAAKSASVTECSETTVAAQVGGRTEAVAGVVCNGGWCGQG